MKRKLIDLCLITALIVIAPLEIIERKMKEI
jgi:hypothetical protein